MNNTYKNHEIEVNELLKNVGIAGNTNELEQSLYKISDDLKLCAVISNANHPVSTDIGDVMAARSLFIKMPRFTKIFSITTPETIGTPPNSQLTVTVAFTPLGIGFLELVTKDIEPEKDK